MVDPVKVGVHSLTTLSAKVRWSESMLDEGWGPLGWRVCYRKVPNTFYIKTFSKQICFMRVTSDKHPTSSGNFFLRMLYVSEHANKHLARALTLFALGWQSFDNYLGVSKDIILFPTVNGRKLREIAICSLTCAVSRYGSPDSLKHHHCKSGS